MYSQRERVAAYRDAVAGTGATNLRMAFATTDAIALAGELSADEARHADNLIKAVAVWKDLPKGPEPHDFEATLAHTKKVAEAADLFWDAFEGQIVDGVEIIRRR